MPKSRQLETLSYAVRPRVLARYLGQFALVLAGLGLVPAAIYGAWGEADALWRQAVVIALLAGGGLVAARVPAPSSIQDNEALALTVLTFLLTPLITAWPFVGSGLSWDDALFEAFSAVTTTGLSTLKGVEMLPAGFLFHRAWMQWYGGLGILVLVVALIAGHAAASRRLLQAGAGEDLASTARGHARRVVVVYLALTGAALLAVLPQAPDGYLGLTHVLTAVSTGGFSTHEASLAALPPGMAWTLMAFALAGAGPLPLYHAVAGRPGRLWRDTELRALVAACVIAAVLATLLLHRTGLAWPEALNRGALIGLSAQTGTGYSNMDVARLPPIVLAVLLVPMFIGGCTGSTAGGIKLLRLLLGAKVILLWLRRSAMPRHAVAKAWLGRHALEPRENERTLLLLLLFLLTILVSWLPFVAAGYPPLPALFDVVSATCTVGLSAGVVQHGLTPELKAILCFDMLAGRVEILALLVLLYAPTWLGRRKE